MADLCKALNANLVNMSQEYVDKTAKFGHEPT